jgi:hypothetical protein
MKAHRTDRVSLTFGLLFLAVAAWWLVSRLVDLPLPAGGWFVAGALILIGLLGVVGALRSARAPGGGDPAVEPVTAPPATGPVD